MPPPWKVLLVDDQDIFVRSVEALLETSAEIEVVGQAWNGEVALELAAERSPDVVLMDIDMPVMDGVEATRLLGERFPDVRVLILSGLHEPERIDAALAAGAVGSLAKGNISDELIEAVAAAGRGDAVSPGTS